MGRSTLLAHDVEHVVNDDIGIKVHQNKVRVDNPVLEAIRERWEDHPAAHRAALHIPP